ncbi:hypothetical protein T310_10060 [Rasamsonia emersonii CBS 393.64]|uniref:Uncharacterized protein n=1 Tax=Rasamsonia emersonii (strain ATCC 16479 / CBS 393.64 / IMI 116815) TaxID=1408163 RepID=A0A0F4YDV5_RASE3|nr:hypothetical protein T310_10060 [Rasamsonia emersonii CBS 393.64]KKA16364.1 hypothetical protein T310_10060 [Rasamsonia emersonii CBS 393.64]
MATTVLPGIDLTASKQPQIRGAILSTWLLAVLAVGLRFTSRWLVKAGFWWDDWLILLGLVITHAALPSEQNADGKPHSTDSCDGCRSCPGNLECVLPSKHNSSCTRQTQTRCHQISSY